MIRGKIWNTSEVFAYYKQNMFIVAHESISIQSQSENIKIIDIVHPGTFEERNRYIKHVESGKRGVTYYIPLLLKSIINRFRK
jgi:hypothetical protein